MEMLNNLSLQNLSNHHRTIYLFTREQNGTQKIIKYTDFFPFYFEPTKNPSKYVSYDGIPLKIVHTSEPNEIPKMRSLKSYSSDVKFTTNFLIYKIDCITKSSIKYCFMDIEILAKEMPNPKEAKYPISCISIYNSFSNELKTWFLGDWKDENNMLDDFVIYIKKEKFDLIMGWNLTAFDYVYLFNRIKDFHKRISPIELGRLGEEKGVYYPAGISIIDYMKWFKKVYNRESSYALDAIAQKKLGEQSFKKVDFSILNPEIKEKNVNDINRLIKLENEYKLIPYMDEIRRLSKVTWEDLYYNSRVAEMFLFEEAKKKNIILPNKPKILESEETTFEGAVRDIEAKGIYENISKADLASAYPSMILNFCLDAQNITNSKEENTIEINNLHFRQNPDTLLPLIVKKILVLKDSFKKQKKKYPNDKDIQIKYEAIKAVANSLFGVNGNIHFRLYNNNVAATITFLVRDLLMYVKKQIENDGVKVIYYDTDSLFLNTKEDITPKLNNYIKQWALEKYSKQNIDLQFEYEGYFTKIAILGRCHYYGFLEGKQDPEIKGIEAKRNSSSKYESYFQLELLNKVLNKTSQKEIEFWINQEKERIKTLSLEEVSFPVKIANKEYSKNTPIFLRAYNNTQKIKKDFHINKGEIFYYLFTNSGRNEVLAFTPENKDFISKHQVDWNTMIERNINSKTKRIFEAMNWVYLSPDQLTLI